MRRLMGALVVSFAGALFAAQAAAADVKTFSVRGGSGAAAYAGTVRVTTLPTNETATVFMSVEWTFGAYVIKGFGIVAKDDPTLLTVSYVVPAGLGVGRYKVQPDGSALGTLAGEAGIFVQEVWTSLDAPREAPPNRAPPPPPRPLAPADMGNKHDSSTTE